MLTEQLSQEDLLGTSEIYYEVYSQPRAIHGQDVYIMPVPLFKFQRVRTETPIQALRRRIKRESGLAFRESASLKEEENLRLFSQEPPQGKKPEMSPISLLAAPVDEDVISSMLQPHKNEIKPVEDTEIERNSMAVVPKTGNPSNARMSNY